MKMYASAALVIAALLTLTGSVAMAADDSLTKQNSPTQKKVAGGADEAKADDSGAVFIDHEKVAAGFDKGAVLLVEDKYRVHAGFRDKGGLPEIHERDTDVFHILEGGATLVTGGVMVDPVVAEPGETRGNAIRGGVTRQIVKGDVIVIPPNVPHWFKEVSGKIKYFVVKVR